MRHASWTARRLGLLIALAFIAAAAPTRAQMPAGCAVWFDGCNTCTRTATGVSCTRWRCVRLRPRRCLRRAAPLPANCVVWFDGCNTCRGARGPAGPAACTRRACRVRGRARCLKLASHAWARPAGCRRWFDGCNTCTAGGGCTKMFCAPGRYRPARCLDAAAMAPDCRVWTDGCRVCQRTARGVVCDRKVCAVKGRAGCITRVNMPPDCQRSYDGCNTCERTRLGIVCTNNRCPRHALPRCVKRIAR